MKRFPVSLAKSLCKKYGCKLKLLNRRNLKSEDPTRFRNKNFRNRAWFYCGTKTRKIVIGLYRNPERKTASFFHELGHVVTVKNISDLSTLSRVYYGLLIEWEKIAWAVGLTMAMKHDIHFSKRTLGRCRKALQNYGEISDNDWRRILPK